MVRRSRHLRALDALRAQTEKSEERLIAEARAALLIPFCDRTGFRFTAGMGTWSFDKKDKRGHSVDIAGWDTPSLKRLPAGLLAFLQSDSVCYRNNDLGSLMEDYTPKGWK